MPIVSDFETIVGDASYRVGDSAQPRRFNFSTGGRKHSRTAYIVLMVKGMTVTNRHAKVFLNDKDVGLIFNNNGGGVNQWQTQTIHFNGSDLRNGENTVEFHGVTYEGGGADHFDDYYVRNVICHYHQEA
mgnify:CR=1 FL=1